MVRCVHRLSLRCERMLANAGDALMMLRAVGLGAVVHGAAAGGGGSARGEPRGGGACRQSDQSSWGSVAGTESRRDDASDVAEPQWYAACIGGQLRCERELANAGDALMMLRAVGWGGCARGCSGWWGFCSGRAEGRRCVQTITSEKLEQRRWHRVSEG